MIMLGCNNWILSLLIVCFAGLVYCFGFILYKERKDFKQVVKFILGIVGIMTVSAVCLFTVAYILKQLIDQTTC